MRYTNPELEAKRQKYIAEWEAEKARMIETGLQNDNVVLMEWGRSSHDYKYGRVKLVQEGKAYVEDSYSLVEIPLENFDIGNIKQPHILGSQIGWFIKKDTITRRVSFQEAKTLLLND